MPHSSCEPRANMAKVRIFTFLVLFALLSALPSKGHTQTQGRRVATLELLTSHPLFFHGQNIVIRAHAVGEQVLTYLVDGDLRVLVVNVPPPPQAATENVEITGTFYDVGRLDPQDPRTVGQPFERISNSLLEKPWPSVGELLLIVAQSSRQIVNRGETTLREVVLNPKQYLNRGITVTGRFRGRNLYGDLPRAPGESPYDFVLASANAALWVVGKEPKGDDFELDVRARRDTGRWLEVTGEMTMLNGMVIVEAGTILLADPIEEQPTLPTPVTMPQAPPPEVIFSTPLEAETNVPTDTMVRLQFSQDMDPESFLGRITISYSSLNEQFIEPSLMTFSYEYRALNRVIEIRLAEPLDPFGNVSVELLEGITTRDGTPLQPWSLSFLVAR